MQRSGKWLGQQTAALDALDIPGLEGTRAARRMMQAGVIIYALRIPLTIIAMIAISAVPALAQTPGPIFNGNPSNFSNMVREGMKLLAVLLFVGGGVAVAWMIVNIMGKKEWNRQLIGAILAFGFGTVVAVLYSVSAGKPVDVGTDF